MKNFAVMLTVSFLAACSTTPVNMTYTAKPGAATTAKPLAAIGEVKDSRKYTGQALGAIRDGWGRPLKTLQLQQPAAEIVKANVLEGLKSRGMVANGNAKYDLNITIAKFDCSQYNRREAHVSLLVTLVDKGTKQEVYNRNIITDKKNGSIITFDSAIFASVEDLRVLANEALQEAIDQLLDDPNFASKFN